MITYFGRIATSRFYGKEVARARAAFGWLTSEKTGSPFFTFSTVSERHVFVFAYRWFGKPHIRARHVLGLAAERTTHD